MTFSYRSLPLTPIGYVLFQPTHLIPWGDERSKLTTGSAARHSTLAPSQKQQEQDQRKELHNLQQQQQHGQDWDHEGTSPYQDDSTGANGQGDGDAPLPGNSTASVGVEGPDVLLEEQDEVVALLVQVNERHEKQLAFERVLQERDGFWRKRHVTLGASSSDSIDVIVDASLWRSVSDKVAYNSEKSPSPVPTPQLKQAEVDSIQLSSNSSSSEKSLAVSPEACVSNVLEQAETHNVEPSQRPDEDEEEAPPQIVDKEDCHKLVESQIESQGSSHEVKLPKREYSYKPSSYSYREYHSNKRYSERNSQSSGSSNIRFNNQVTGCLLKNQMNSQKNVHVSDRSKSRYICQSNSHKVQQNDLKQQYDGGSNRESYGQENDQTLDKQPNNRPNGKPQTQSHGHPGNQSNCQARNKSSRQFNSQSSYHPNNQHRGRSNHYPSSQYNNQYKDRPDSRRDGNPNNQSTCQSSTYLNTKNANRHTSQSDNQPRCQSNRSNDFSEKNVQEHLHRTPRSSLPYCCQNVNERACSPADLSATPRGHQKQEPPPPPPPPRPYSAPRPLQSDQNNKNHEKSTTSQQSEAQRPTRKDRRRNGASSNGSRKSAVSPSGGTVPLQQERTQAVACRKPIPLKMFWESNDMTIFRKRTS